MKRLVGYVIGLGVLVAVLFMPAVFWNISLGDEAVEETSISSYVADFDLAKNGDLTVSETLTVNFPGYGKHGIFRFFDHADQSAPNARRIPHDITVTMDGEDVEFELQKTDHGRFTNAKIGSASVFVPAGEHVYEIGYQIDGVIEPGTTGQESQFYWNLIPGGWLQDIDESQLTVHLPAEAQDVRCAVGAGKDTGCTAEGEGTTTLTVTTGHLDANTPVTIKTGLDIPTPDAGDTLPWTARFDRVLGPNVFLLILVILLAAAAAVTGATIGKRSRETDPGFPIMYAPPDGIGPAQATYMLNESIDKEAYVATLMYAAEKGAVDLSKANDAWSITDKGGPGGWAGLDPITSGVAHLLGGPGTTFTASPKDVTAGKRLKDEIDTFESDTASWAKSSGNLVGSGLGSMGALIVLAGFAAAIAMLIWNPFSMTMIGLIPGAFAICGVSLLAKGSGTKRTRTGRDLWSRVGGFHRILSTDSAEDRFDFSGREELYTAYIPWAVAFGCADQWAAKYKIEMGAEPPVPHYFAGYAGYTAGSMVSSMVNDFSSTVDSAISSYNATQTSSSSGGGGFSGGGGGGGGGGGSW